MAEVERPHTEEGEDVRGEDDERVGGDLIRNGPNKLIPLHQPAGTAAKAPRAQGAKSRPFRTQHVR
jgi:hypothetical protein